MAEKTIEEIVDFHVKKWADLGLNMLPEEIEKDMAGPTNEDGWTTWYPIASKVTDAEIEDFEQLIGHRFPADYKRYLKYKHFYDLHIGEASFSHPVKVWRRAHVGLIYEGYPPEFLIDKGYLPIAGWSDWGLLCFDTNRNDGQNNYSVVQWDHDGAHRVRAFYKDFTDLLRGLDREASERELEEQ